MCVVFRYGLLLLLLLLLLLCGWSENRVCFLWSSEMTLCVCAHSDFVCGPWVCLLLLDFSSAPAIIVFSNTNLSLSLSAKGGEPKKPAAITQFTQFFFFSSLNVFSWGKRKRWLTRFFFGGNAWGQFTGRVWVVSELLAPFSSHVTHFARKKKRKT